MMKNLKKLNKFNNCPINIIEGNKSKEEKININKAAQTEIETLPGIGPSTALKIINYRNEHGKFEGFTDFCERVEGEAVNKKCVESLIKAGTFDEFPETRATLLASFEALSLIHI